MYQPCNLESTSCLGKVNTGHRLESMHVQQQRMSSAQFADQESVAQGLLQEIVGWCELKASTATAKPATYRCERAQALLSAIACRGPDHVSELFTNCIRLYKQPANAM